MADECFAATITNILSHMVLDPGAPTHTVAGQIWLQTWGQDKLARWVSVPDEGRGLSAEMAWAGGVDK